MKYGFWLCKTWGWYFESFDDHLHAIDSRDKSMNGGWPVGPVVMYDEKDPSTWRSRTIC